MNDITDNKPYNLSAEFIDKDNISLSYWFNIYFSTQVLGSSSHTIKAKTRDISLFINFFSSTVGTDNIQFWTSSVSKSFQQHLYSKYKTTTVNRMFATLRHAAKWISSHVTFSAGNPFNNVKDLCVDDPDFKALTSQEIARLKAACDQRIALCKKNNQNPLAEAAIFYTLLYTGLRESELINLNIEDYYASGFHNVKRKGKKVTRKVYLPSDAKEFLDNYLKQRELKNDKPLEPSAPLFVTIYNKRFKPLDVIRVCKRIANQASVNLNEKIKLTPHMLRHTFLKKTADKHDIHVAHHVSGNVSMREIFRYTKPSQKETEDLTEKLYN